VVTYQQVVCLGGLGDAHGNSKSYKAEYGASSLTGRGKVENCNQEWEQDGSSHGVDQQVRICAHKPLSNRHNWTFKETHIQGWQSMYTPR
jgi:hypothetical protein